MNSWICVHGSLVMHVFFLSSSLTELRFCLFKQFVLSTVLLLSRPVVTLTCRCLTCKSALLLVQCSLPLTLTPLNATFLCLTFSSKHVHTLSPLLTSAHRRRKGKPGTTRENLCSAPIFIYRSTVY